MEVGVDDTCSCHGGYKKCAALLRGSNFSSVCWFETSRCLLVVYCIVEQAVLGVAVDLRVVQATNIELWCSFSSILVPPVAH